MSTPHENGSVTPITPTHSFRAYVLALVIGLAVAGGIILLVKLNEADPIAEKVGPQVTAYFKLIDAPQLSSITGYTDHDDNVVGIRTTLYPKSDNTSSARSFCGLLWGQEFKPHATFVILASDGSEMASCGTGPRDAH